MATTSKEECAVIQVRDTEGRLIEVDCALPIMGIVQAWEAQFPGVPLMVSMDSNAQGPILWLGNVSGPAASGVASATSL